MKNLSLGIWVAAIVVIASSASAVNPLYAQDNDNRPVAYMVSNAHLDSQWNWDVQTTINEYIPATLYRNLTLLERYPNYVFNCESAIKYIWMKEYYPEAYSKIGKYVSEGRWHLSGGGLEASDANVPSPEALIRNILLGEHFYEREFGVLSTDIFLPDCFGFGQHLPTVAAHCGLMGFTTQKLQWRNNPFYGKDKEPFSYGKWRGVDGSEIYAALRTGYYTKKFNGGDLSLDKEVLKLATASPHNIVDLFYGVGDRGGSPTLSSAECVCHGENGNGPLKVVSATSDQMFKDLQRSGMEVETFDGEFLMDVHGTGCYTSQAAMKLFNRRNELLLDAAERSSVAAELLSGEIYPRESLNTIWQRVIWHQFHDDLTGTSIPRAYEFSWNDELISLSQAEKIEENAVSAVASLMDTRVNGEALVLYNPSAFDRTDVVTIQGSWIISDPSGRSVKIQSGQEGTTMFVAEVPALGFRVYSARPAKATATRTRNVAKSAITIRNSVYELTVNEGGDISSIKDLRCGRQLVEEGKTIRLAAIEGNLSEDWPAWEITKATIDTPSKGIYDNVSVCLLENGPVCKTIRIVKSLGESVITQYVRLYEGANASRIDIMNDIRWESMATLLKAEFPLSVSNPNARYDIGTGSIERNNNTLTKYEVYAQQWADLTAEDGSYGVSIMNDCKYGWDKPSDNTLRLTLLHTPAVGKNYVYQNRQDLGHHIFTYSIEGHQGDWNSCGIVNKAESLNQPVRAFLTEKHNGPLGRQWSLLKASGASVKAVKKAEDGDGYIVRLFEVKGTRSDVKLDFAFPVSSVEELNGNEKPVSSNLVPVPAATPVQIASKSLYTAIEASGVRTFRVRFDNTALASTFPQAPIDLRFNSRSATFNAFRKDGTFDTEGYSYAAEILPREILHRGVVFPLGDPIEKNALRCAGESLNLPEGSWNKVRMLVASKDEDYITDLGLVPSYTGFIGQWGHSGHTDAFIKDVDVAYVGTHRHGSDNLDHPYEFTYMFCVEIPVAEGATSFTLPENRNIAVFSAVAVNDSCRGIKAVDGAVAGAENLWTALKLGIPARRDAKIMDVGFTLLPKHVTACSGMTGEYESPAQMLDDDLTTMWCHTGGPGNKFVEFDLGSVQTINGWKLLHVQNQSAGYVTQDFCLQVKDGEDGEWRTVDSVTGNKARITERKLDCPVRSRYLRLYITKAHQTAKGGGDCGTSRIVEMSIF